jgi:hypothetical protein
MYSCIVGCWLKVERWMAEGFDVGILRLWGLAELVMV